MNDEEKHILNGPPRTSYIEYHKHAFFTYSSKEAETFQHGYLGIGPSYITGNFHLCYPASEPLHLKKVEISLVGQEYALYESIFYRLHKSFSRCFCQYTYDAWEHSDFKRITNLTLKFNIKLEDDLPGSFEVDNTMNASINYTLKATIISDKNVEKIVSVKCHINRWCLPVEFLEQPIVMKNPDQDKSTEVYKVGDIIVDCEWNMGDKISMFINLTSLKQNITEINIKEVKLHLLELQYVMNNNDIVAGNKLESTGVIIDKKKLSILPHPSGSKYTFEAGMLFQGDIGIINSLTPEEIKE
ncbi:23794_t:CDS:2, partial [Gigaspora rosea]